jgi:heme-degrading monooxygenase HmoA
MHARVTITQLQPGKSDEAIHIFRDSVVPVAQELKGFKGALLLTDPATGRGMSITLWETETDLTAGETSGVYGEQVAKFAGIIAAPPVREAYEVSVQV